MEREVQDHAEARMAQLEKNWITVISVRRRRTTLVLETYILYFPITRCFHHRSLDYMPPLLSFMYSFTRPLSLTPHSATMSIGYEPALFQAQGFTRQPEGNGLCYHMPNHTLFLLRKIDHLGISSYKIASAWCQCHCLIHNVLQLEDNWYIMNI